MSKPAEDDDPDLRTLLDRIGIRSTFGHIQSDQEVRDRSRAERDFSAITAHDPPARKWRVKGPTRWMSRWQTRALLGLAVACVIGLVLYLVLPSSTPPAEAQTPPMLSFSSARTSGVVGLQGGSAVEELGDLARAAAAQPPSSALPIQRVRQYAWWAVSDSGEDKATTSVLVPVQRSTYLLPNGRLRDIEGQGNALDQDGRVSAAQGSWNIHSPTSDDTTKTDQPADYPETLPTDPAKLLKVLAPNKGCGGDPGDCALNALADIFTTYVVSARAAAALWQAVAQESDIEALGATTDRLGRSAVAFAAPPTKEDEQTVVLADPASGAFLGYETILTKANSDFSFTPPVVTAFTAVLDAERVAHAPAR